MSFFAESSRIRVVGRTGNTSFDTQHRHFLLTATVPAPHTFPAIPRNTPLTETNILIATSPAEGNVVFVSGQAHVGTITAGVYLSVSGSTIRTTGIRLLTYYMDGKNIMCNVRYGNYWSEIIPAMSRPNAVVFVGYYDL